MRSLVKSVHCMCIVVAGESWEEVAQLFPYAPTVWRAMLSPLLVFAIHATGTLSIW